MTELYPFHGIAPWVGSGVLSDPYQMSVLPITWMWRAKIILAGLTCWHPRTGKLDEQSPRFRELGEMSARTRVVMPVGSGLIVRTEASEQYVGKVLGVGDNLPCYPGELPDFASYVFAQEAALLERLSGEYPDLDWEGDPVVAAVTVLDTLREDGEDAEMLWGYYRSVLDPTLPTSNGPVWLYEGVGGGTTADIERCREVANTPDDVTHPMRRAELGFRCVYYREAAEALRAGGL